MLTKIKSGMANYILRKRLKLHQRRKKVYNLQSARRIGILFDATDEKEFDHVMEFYKYLKLKGIVVFVLGYVNDKDVPDKYLFKKNFNFFLRKNLNWYHRPVSHESERFIKENFDILIDLNLRDCFPCQYIIALSPAHFKVGKYSERASYYDLMIDIKKENNIYFLIEQTKHYLEVINRPELSPNIMN